MSAMHKPKTLESVLPPENPLRSFPYWDSPEGKNLNAIACLEWLESYIKVMDAELPCPENKDALWHVGKALKVQKRRIEERRKQGVLGTMNPHEYRSGELPVDGG